MVSRMWAAIDHLIFTIIMKNIHYFPERFVKLIAHYYPDARVRKAYWGKLGVKMGEGTFPNMGFQCTSNQNNISIGKNVSIAPNVLIISESSANNGEEINRVEYVKNELTKVARVVIEDETWIGANVTILPGVTIGRCSIIGANSLIVKDVEPYSIYAGNPAEKIKDLSEQHSDGI